jgi:hypothetical protein
MTYTDQPEFEDTCPTFARWDGDISGDGSWIRRCAGRMAELRPEIDLDFAHDPPTS